VKLRGRWLTQAHTIHRVVQVNVRRIMLQTLLLGVAFSALLAIPVAIYQQAETSNLLSLRQAEQERVIKLAAQSIHQEMDAVLSDLRYLSQHNEIRSYLQNGDRGQRRNLALEYLVLAQQKRIYDQIRFIGLDGMEEVRVDFANGKPIIRAEQDLQDKHDRYYVQEVQWLSPGQIYVSPFDLNIEQGVIEKPLKPVIRFAVPVADSQGLIRGMVVLNYLGQRLIDKLSLLPGQTGQVWLLNTEGQWLIGPTRKDEWQFMFPQKPQPTAPPLFDAFRQQAMLEKNGLYRSEDKWIRFERVYPLTGGNPYPNPVEHARPVAMDRYYWTLAVAFSASPQQSPKAFMSRDMLPTYGALSLFAFLAAGALAYVGNRNKALSQVMERVLDDLPLLVAYVDAKLCYRFNNMAYQRFFGLSPREIFGKTMPELLGEAAYREIHPYIEQVLAGQTVTFERQLAYAGAGMHDVAVSYLPDCSPQGEVRGFYVLVNDISQIKQSERRERQRLQELAHVSRLASMGEMATEIAHEINQPMAAIAMFSAAGLRSLHADCDCNRMQSWLEAINAQAKRASEIVRRVRNFVRKGSHQHGPVNLNQVADEVSALLRHESQSQGVEVVLQLAEGLPSVYGDLVLLEQVVFNLVRNAMEALLRQPGGRRITLATSFDADRVYVEVRDTGPGIEPDISERIFDSFVTSKQEGIGMGLAISRSIIEAHGSKLRYVVNPEGGVTFMFSLAREAL
jgi:PAS domain S-box-containing protein